MRMSGVLGMSSLYGRACRRYMHPLFPWRQSVRAAACDSGIARAGCLDSWKAPSGETKPCFPPGRLSALSRKRGVRELVQNQKRGTSFPDPLRHPRGARRPRCFPAKLLVLRRRLEGIADQPRADADPFDVEPASFHTIKAIVPERKALAQVFGSSSSPFPTRASFHGCGLEYRWRRDFRHRRGDGIGYEAQVPAPLIRFWMDLDPEYRLVWHEHLDNVFMVRARRLQRHPLLGDAHDPVHVVCHAVDRESLEVGTLQPMAQKRFDGGRKDVLEEPMSKDSRIAALAACGPLRSDNSGGQVNHALRLSHAPSVGNEQGCDNRPRRRERLQWL